jgi:hypothetical protein
MVAIAANVAQVVEVAKLITKQNKIYGYYRKNT